MRGVGCFRADTFDGHRFIVPAGPERYGLFIGGFELDRKAEPFPAVFGLENTKVQVRSTGESGIARQSQPISSMDALPRLYLNPPLMQMAVVRESAVIVTNQNIIIVLIVF